MRLSPSWDVDHFHHYLSQLKFVDTEESTVTARGLLGALKVAILGCGALFAIGGIPAVIGARAGLDYDSLFLIEIGVLYVCLTILRPSWFWNHRTSVLLRIILGNRGTVALYVFLALLMMVTGTRRMIAITSATRACKAEFESAKDSHEKFLVLYRSGSGRLPNVSSGPSSLTCERLLEPR
jgi:hypothetical protein